MASITIRQLGDDLKRQLRLRAARNGRSMEDEARTILRDAASLAAGRIEATADLMAKLAGGHADDLASAVLVATDRKVLLAPAMNPHMWQHKATQRNLARLVEDGVALVGPNTGEMAEAGEAGIGRMAEPLEIAAAVVSLIGDGEGALKGKREIVTS